MIVTQIVPMSQARCKIYMDQKFAFVLYKGELHSYGLREGEEIPDSVYRQIVTQVLPLRAKKRLMNLLQKKDYTVWQLSEKLKKDGYPGECIAQALEYVAAFHYTDDVRYALSYIRSSQEGKGRRRIEAELTTKGVAAKDIEKAWEQWEAEGNVQEEEEQIRQILEKKHYFPEADEKEKRRIFAFLQRRGYSVSAICHVLCANSWEIENGT